MMDNLIDALAGHLRSDIMPTLYPLCGLFLLLQWGYVYAQTMIASSDTNVDYKPVVRGICLVIGVFSYEEIFWLIEQTTDYVAELLTPKNGSQVMAHLNHMSAALKHANDKHQGDVLNGDSPIMHPLVSLQTAWNNFTSTFAWLFMFVSQGVALIVRAFVSKIQVFFVAFLFFVGPIAFIMSILPGFEGTYKGWLKWLLTAKMMMFSIAIIDLVVEYIDNAIVADTAAGGVADMSGMLNIVIANLVVITFYFLAPLLTAIYIGGSAAVGAFLNKSIATGAAVGSKAFGMVTGGRSGGGSGGGGGMGQLMPSAAQLIPTGGDNGGNAALHNPAGSSSQKVETTI